MKKVRVALACVLALLFCVGCASSGTKVAKPSIEHPPYCEEFLKVVGKDIKKVIPALGLTNEDFRDEAQTSGWYVLNKPVEYLGYTFEMRLSTTVDNAGVRYVHTMTYFLCDETPETGAESVTDLRDKLMKGYGSAYNAPKYSSGNYGQEETNAPSPLNTMDKTELLEQFEKEGGYGTSVEWLLSTDVSQLPKEALSLWGEPPTCVTAQLSAAYPVEEDGKTVVLTRLIYGLSRSYRASGKA